MDEWLAERLWPQTRCATGEPSSFRSQDRYAFSLKRRLDDPDERVTAGELEAFARLEYRVENKRRLERLNELTRDKLH